jgi:hypothetical protein
MAQPKGKMMNKDKQNKTFALSVKAVTILKDVLGKSAFVEELIVGKSTGRFISLETADIMAEYKKLFGAEPEKIMQFHLAKRIKKMKANMMSLKESPKEEVKNKVGGAFLKLNQAFHDLITENQNLEHKLAITFGLLFKKTGCNHSSIRNWIRVNQLSLDEYHLSVGIVDPVRHNRHLGVLKRIAQFEEKTKLKQKEVQKEVARIKRQRLKQKNEGNGGQEKTDAKGKKAKKEVAK